MTRHIAVLYLYTYINKGDAMNIHIALPGGVLPIMAYTGRLRPKGVPFSGFRYIKG